MASVTGIKGLTKETAVEIEEFYAKLQGTFKSGKTRSVEWRIEQLKAVRAMMSENSDTICEAVKKDLNRSRVDAFLTEVVSVIGEVDVCLMELKEWMQPEVFDSSNINVGAAKSTIQREPKGVILNIATWNYPFALTLQPVVDMIAAGNCCFIKPSELSEESSKVMAELIPKYLDTNAFAVITGAVPETTALLRLRWDHIMYTGNGTVGRIIARAAAEHLTPMTLELGGKSPALILPGADLKTIVKRIASYKCLNIGQTCVTVDFIIVHESIEKEFIDMLISCLKEWYGDDQSTVPHWGRMINDRHWARINNLVGTSGGEIVLQQGTPDRTSKFMPFTIIKNPSTTSPIMREEIFGPVLPILTKASVDDMIACVNTDGGAKPLGLYIFGSDEEADQILPQINSGGVTVNEVMMHAADHRLPFGGTGESGMGKYHGKHGFDEFSHHRSVLYKSVSVPDPETRFPPSSQNDEIVDMMKTMLIGQGPPQV